MNHQNTRHAFTLIELLVVISIIALLIGILLPALGAARESARKLQSNTQMRGMQQGMVVHAQDNKGYYPGIESSGDRWVPAADNYSAGNGGWVEARFAIMIESEFVTPEYLLHPNESEPHTAYSVGSGDTFTIEHYSYALLEISGSVGFPTNSLFSSGAGAVNRAEWRETMNSQAIVLSDRLIDVTSFGDPSTYTGIWSDRPGDSDWGVVWNDNHTGTNNTAIFQTKYRNVTNTADNLYARGRTSNGNVQTPALSGAQYGNAMMVSREGTRLRQIVP